MTNIYDLVDRCKEFFATRMDFHVYRSLVVSGDKLYVLAKYDSGQKELAADFYLVAAFYSSILQMKLTPEDHMIRLREVLDDYDPSARYAFFQEQRHHSHWYNAHYISREQRRLLNGFDRFTSRYPVFDYQNFFEVYFPNTTQVSEQKHQKLADVIDFAAARERRKIA